jgi:hypothetical protein
MSVIMSSRQLPLSLVVLPTEVNIDVADHLAATSKRAMDDLCSLQATFREMLRTGASEDRWMVAPRCDE